MRRWEEAVDVTWGVGKRIGEKEGRVLHAATCPGSMK